MSNKSWYLGAPTRAEMQRFIQSCIDKGWTVRALKPKPIGTKWRKHGRNPL